VKSTGLSGVGENTEGMAIPHAPRVVIRPATLGLLLVGVALVALGVVYVVTPAQSLPSLVPGHDPTGRHHIKHGLAAFTAAVATWVAAWFTTAPRSAP